MKNYYGSTVRVFHRAYEFKSEDSKDPEQWVEVAPIS